MNRHYPQIKNVSFYGAVILEYFFPRRTRAILLHIFKDTLLFVGIVSIVLFSLRYPSASISTGIFLILFSFYLVLFSLHAFFASFFTDREGEVLAGQVIYSSKTGDLVHDFLFSDFGRSVMLRAEVSNDAVNNFLEGRRSQKFIFEVPAVSGRESLNIVELGEFLFENDADFKTFLSKLGIDKKIFLKISEWVLADVENEWRRSLWWSEDYLRKARGLAKDWSYGRLFYLLKYSVDLFTEVKEDGAFDIKEFKEEVKQLESVLIKGQDSSAIIVGEPGAGVHDMLLEFAKKLKRGKVSPEIEYKRIYSLVWNNLIAANKDKTGFESEFIRVLNEAAYAGNIIIVIEDLPSFLASAISMGSNVTSILVPYLTAGLQVIATSDPVKFHKSVEPEPELARFLNKIVVLETDEDKTIEIVENTVRKIESSQGVYFTYLAIAEIVRGSAQYFPDKVFPDGAIDLLLELLSSPLAKDSYVNRDDVLDIISMKTKIPLTSIGASEKDKLLHLEDILHDRVVGQEEAINAIANAMRRSRANIRNVKKPIGTFLFLGPTGVGKTETAKALAAVFFSDESHMLRLDMTEYQAEDSVKRLIGSFDLGKPGVLASMLRESPYGVLLLDEFEKAHKDVQNLFLQILDEGFFSDMNGKKVSLRNTIIVATSNAASEYIFELVKNSKEVSLLKDDIIDKVIKDGSFKPELINRFDASVVFHPLTPAELTKIAALTLKKLRSRLAEKGIDFVITEQLSSVVAKLGSNEKFGARPMNRFIQDKIEEPLAKRIISGELSSGSKVEIDVAELLK